MKKFIQAWLAVSVFTLFVYPHQAESQTAQDSIQSVTVAPGIAHTSYKKSGPYTLNVLEIDLTNLAYRIESYRPNGLVLTTKQVQENAKNGANVVAAINADFFSFKTGWPINNQVVNGKFVLGTVSTRSLFAMDDRGRPYIERLTFRGWVKTSVGRVYPISGVNDQHKNNSIVLHTSYSDTSTSWGSPGVKYLLQLLNSRWLAGDTLKMLVSNANVNDSQTISGNEAILWVGSGDEVWKARNEIKARDTLSLYLGFAPNLTHIQNVVGGGGRILLQGKAVSDTNNTLEKVAVPFLKARHPRTFVGFNRGKTKLYLCTVDGRQATSIGMNFQEMADFLLSIGVWDAINLDGGGSTTMVVNGRIVNSPSDKTGERAVANSLQVIRVGSSKDN
ncbi:MAG: phosphodiester glycosidase family protein [Ignavibacteriales bacterium]|nr:phosphodiester glycosidase family protein [Ignavibacteriales bacterium]